jgi:phosphate-selective porin OprO/OprP
MFRLLVLVSCMLFSLQSLAQVAKKDTSDVVRRTDERFEALPYYSYGKGVGMTSPDSIFQLNIRFRMQNRMEIAENGGDTYVSAGVRRLRLRLEGYVGDPKFMYLLQLGFSPDDHRPLGETNGNLNIVRDAMVYYRPNSKWMLGFGQTKLPGNRQRVNSSGALQLTDRSINNSNFNLDRDFGAQVQYFNDFNEKFFYNVKTSVSTGEGRDRPDSKDKGLAYTARLELYPLGLFKKNGEYFEGDLQRESRPKLYLGGTYHFNHRSKRTYGQRGVDLYEMRDAASVMVDGVLKYRGFAVMGAYMNRIVANPLTYNSDSTSVSAAMAGYGYDAQMSYLFQNNFELIGRYSHFTPDSDVVDHFRQNDQYTIGVAKYIWEHALKLQVEFTWNNYFRHDKFLSDGSYIRFQIEMGI